MTSPNGQWLKFTYDVFNRITQASDNVGRTVSYQYDASGRLFRVTDPNNGVTEYTYDSSHRMLTVKDARGIVFLTNQYDPTSGRITQQTQADSGVYQFAYTTDANGNVTETDVTDPRGTGWGTLLTSWTNSANLAMWEESSHMPRQARLDAAGTLHHVIIRGIERRRIVDDDQDRRAFILRLGKLAMETGTSIYAWALMTNHAHLLLSSGPQGLARFMRRFLTGYAVSYNLRHRRHGHLFQNRYKSIVCDGDSYFTEVVRYIHLNPLRVKLVADLRELERYPYCGHGLILGTIRNDWQERDSVLSQFGSREGDAREVYRRFVAEGVELGRRPELVGGGLIRSAGGWSEVKTLRRRGAPELGDERILGSGGISWNGSLRRQRRACSGNTEIENA